jgi:hypothetical protein
MVAYGGVSRPNNPTGVTGGSNPVLPGGPYGGTNLRPDRYDIFDKGVTDAIKTKEDARLEALKILKVFNLESLVPALTSYIQSYKGADVSGVREEAIVEWISNTREYKERFAANAAREKAGLPKLDPATYLAEEQKYRAALRNYVPEKFYDSYKDFQKFLAADIDATEVGQRAQLAYTLSQQTNPEYRKALKDFYGIGDKDITAYFLDPKKALPILQSRQAVAEIGGEAIQSGLTIGRGYAEQLAAEGFTGANIQPGMVEAAEGKGVTSLLGQVSGTNILDRDLLDESLNRQGQGASKIRQLRSQQRARFGGSSAGERVLGKDELGSF